MTQSKSDKNKAKKKNSKAKVAANTKATSKAKSVSNSKKDSKPKVASKNEATSKTKNVSKAKTGSKPNTASNSKNNSKAKAKSNSPTNTVKTEVIGVLIIAFAVFLIFTLNLDNSMGIFGETLRHISYVLFGRGMFIVSIVFLIVGVMHLINYVYYSEKKQNLAVAVIFLSILVFLSMYDILTHEIFTTASPVKNIFDFSITYNNAEVMGGGILGNVLAWINFKLFGKIGTYIIFIALILVSTIIFTNQSLISFTKIIWNFIKKVFKGIGNLIFDDSESESVPKEKEAAKKVKNGVVTSENVNVINVSDYDMTDNSNERSNKIIEGNLNRNNANNAENLNCESKSEKLRKEELMQLTVDDIETDDKNRTIGNFRNESRALNKQHANEDVIIKDYENSLLDNNINFFAGQIDGVESKSYDSVPTYSGNDKSVKKVDTEKTKKINQVYGIDEKSKANRDIKNKKTVETNENTKSKKTTITNPYNKPSIGEIRKSENQSTDISDTAEEKTRYVLPTLDLLDNPKPITLSVKEDLRSDAEKLIKTLKNFGVDCKLLQINKGPTITRYELSPAPGIKVSKITGLSNDIALSLAAQDVRIEAPIPGKAAVGIEVPNRVKTPVILKTLLASREYYDSKSDISFAIGQDIAGKNIVADIAKMPHLLIAGATGSGKSVCINTLIMSILYKAHPVDVKLILIDPKVVELSIYNGIPHLLIPVVTDPKKASNALNWAVTEMENRYKLFAQEGVRDIHSFNKKMLKENRDREKMSQIVIIIDELADLMQVASKEVENSIIRIAQLARACGIHLIIATQRPSVDVITGTIKANIPSRIAFAVSSYVDSRTILDASGAEKLLGKGDMFFHPMGESKAKRMQCSFVSDEEIKRVVNFISNQKFKVSYTPKEDVVKTPESDENVDEYLEQAINIAINRESISASMLQRKLPIGFNRAAKLLDNMEERGIISGPNGYKPRKVLVDKEELGIED